MEKVWILHRQLINWETADTENDWWLYKKEEDAIRGFKDELDAFYKRFGKRSPEEYSYCYMSDGMVRFEIDKIINFDMWYQEEPVL